MTRPVAAGRRSAPAALALGILALALAAAAPARAQQFSAEMVMGGASSSNVPPSKIYVSDGKVRLETERAGHSSTILIDAHANTFYILLAEQKSYIDANGGGPMSRMSQAFMPIDPDNACPQLEAMAKQMKKDAADDFTCKRVGSEAVNGRDAAKYQGTKANGEVAYAWIDTKLKYLIKSQDQKGVGVQFRNIQEGAQPASLFEIPADYKKMDPQHMMQQRGGGGQQ